MERLTDSARRLVFGSVVYPAIVGARGEGSVFRRLKEFREIEASPDAEVHALSVRKLSGTLAHAVERVPWYRDRIGRLDTSERGLEQRIQELPFLTKADLQENADALRAEGRYRVTRKITGGSTGQAVTVHKDRTATAAEMAASWLGYGWFGIRMGDKGVRFWGQPTTSRRRLRFRAADLAMNRKRFSAFAFSTDDLERYWAECVRFRPDYFYGYVSMLEQFARFVQSSGKDPGRLGLKAVVTTSEVLSDPQRDLISDTFGVRVQNEYGCGEVGPIAYECERGTLHIMSPNVYVEIVGEDGRAVEPGETGAVVVTDLNNRAMPLVRYRVGDWAVRGRDCACGRPFPTLDAIWGRQYDFILGPGGRRYHGEFVMYLFEDARSSGVPIKQFTVSQTGPQQLDVKLVVSADGRPDAERAVRKLFAERLPDFSISIEFVDEIPRRPSGKAVLVENPWIQTQSPTPEGTIEP